MPIYCTLNDVGREGGDDASGGTFWARWVEISGDFDQIAFLRRFLRVHSYSQRFRLYEDVAKANKEPPAYDDVHAAL